jgi:hypothetical protein
LKGELKILQQQKNEAEQMVKDEKRNRESAVIALQQQKEVAEQMINMVKGRVADLENELKSLQL